MGIETRDYEVKKGDSMIGILKRAGLDGRDWKAVYQRPYNATLMKKYGKRLGHIRPGDIVVLPRLHRKTFAEIDKKLDQISDELDRLIRVDLKTRYKLKSLRKEKRDKWKAFKKVRSELDTRKTSKTVADALQQRCIEIDTASAKGLGSEVKAIVDCAKEFGKSKAFTDKLKKLEAEFSAKKIDSTAADKAVDELDAYIRKRDELAAKTRKKLLKIQNYFSKLRYWLYGS